MNTRALHDLFREWRELTELEGQSIVAEDWSRVHDQQRKKKNLQRRISEARSSESRGTDFDEREFRPFVAELVALETANAQLVATHREKTRIELAGFDRAAGNLRGLNRAYGEKTNACWTTYS